MSLSYIPPKCAKTTEPEDKCCVLWCTYISYHIHDPIPLDNPKNHIALLYITQQDDESTSQYLIWHNALLESMNHTSKLSQISGKRPTNLALIWGLRDCHIKWRVAKEQESLITMEDVYRSINRITKTDAHTKAHHEPIYDSIS